MHGTGARTLTLGPGPTGSGTGVGSSAGTWPEARVEKCFPLSSLGGPLPSLPCHPFKSGRKSPLTSVTNCRVMSGSGVSGMGPWRLGPKRKFVVRRGISATGSLTAHGGVLLVLVRQTGVQARGPAAGSRAQPLGSSLPGPGLATLQAAARDVLLKARGGRHRPRCLACHSRHRPPPFCAADTGLAESLGGSDITHPPDPSAGSRARIPGLGWGT